MARTLVRLLLVAGCGTAADGPGLDRGETDTDAMGSETEPRPDPTEPPADPTAGESSGGPSDGSSETGEGPCSDSLECPAELPICVEGECVPCDGLPSPTAACRDRDPAQPVCNGGTCVACTENLTAQCQGTTPACDLETNECVPCTTHEQCRDRGRPACHIAEGSCIEEVTKHNVEDGGLQEIINGLEPGVPHAIELTGTYGPRDLRIDTGRIVALIAVDGARPRLSGDLEDAPAVRIFGGPTVAYLQGIDIAYHSQGVGLRVGGGASAYVDDARVYRNYRGGILVDQDADLTMRNSFVVGNGQYFEPTHGIVVDGGRVDLLYTSVVFNLGAEAASIACDASSDATVRNSIVVGQEAASLDCSLSASFSAFDGPVPGTETVDVGPADPAWFLDPAASDAHLTLLGRITFTGVAEWHTGDPLYDFDGDPRPQVDGRFDFAGADVP